MQLFSLIAAASLAALASPSVSAREIRVGEVDITGFYGPVRTESRIARNKSLGRAWVELTVSESDFIDPPRSEIYRFKVEGLRYDHELGKVLYEDEAGAFVLEKGAFKLRKKTSKRKVDDGFELKDRLFLEVSLELGR